MYIFMYMHPCTHIFEHSLTYMHAYIDTYMLESNQETWVRGESCYVDQSGLEFAIASGVLKL